MTVSPLYISLLVQGHPLRYSVRGDDAVGMVLLLCFFVLSISFSAGRNYFLQTLKYFFVHRSRNSIFDSSLTSTRLFIPMIFQGCLSAGVLMLSLIAGDVEMSKIGMPSWAVVLSCAIFVLVYIVIKWMIYSFIGWTFFNKETTRIWLEAYQLLLSVLGALLFVVTLLSVYTDISQNVWLWAVCGLVVLLKLMMLYKWIMLFFNNLCGFILIVLYFCSLEIIPLILLNRVWQ